MASEAAASPPRGALIVIEGLDRAGKTTQLAKLAENLSKNGIAIKKLRFPDRSTTIGQMIDSYLQSKTDIEDHVIHLLFSANRWELAHDIETSLASGETVLIDRYYYSGIVYSAAKANPSLPLSWAREPDVGLPRPDLVVFLDLEPEQAEARGGYGDEKYEKKEMQVKVRKLFLELKESGREETDDMVVVNAGGGIDEVQERILQLAKKRVAEVQQGVYGETVRRVKKW